jgi:hypothetical protein
MNHTKEPWEVIAVDDMYEIHSKTAGHEVVWSIDSIANAQRIVACVNACEGITNEALEAGVIQSALINFEESLGLEKGEQFCFYDIPVLEDV